MGPDAMIFVFWMLSFKPTFSLSSFTFIKRLLSSSSLPAIRVVSSAYTVTDWQKSQTLKLQCNKLIPVLFTVSSGVSQPEGGQAPIQTQTNIPSALWRGEYDFYHWENKLLYFSILLTETTTRDGKIESVKFHILASSWWGWNSWKFVWVNLLDLLISSLVL